MTARATFWLTGLVLLAATLATWFWAIRTAAVRPLDGVESELLYEASRIRAGLALYVDPLIGTAEVPPSRFYVLYPPTWSAVLALFTTVPVDRGRVLEGLLPSGVLAGRVLAMVAFVTALSLATWRVRPRSGERAAFDPLGWLSLLFALSFFPIVLFGASARPDSLALLLATFGFTRALRRSELDPWSAVFFALALVVKPNMMGLALGVFAHAAWLRRRKFFSSAASGLAIGAAAAGALGVVSHGAFVDHLLRSTAQSPSLALWLEQLGMRLPFVVLPLGLAAGYAWRVRDTERVQITLFALATSTSWAIFCLAKIGSASNYWMEPVVSALAVVATANDARREQNVPAWSGALLVTCGGLLLAQSFWNGVAAIRSALEETPAAIAGESAIRVAARACVSSPTDLILADEPGPEMQIDGRLIGTPFQMAHLFAAGKLPRAPWLGDLERPEIRCVIAQRPELEGEVWSIEHRRFDADVRAAILQRFALDRALSHGGLWVYRRRDDR